MTRLLKSSFIRQFAGGFVLGAIGMMGLHITQPQMPTTPYAASTQVVR